jgi:hypothetical protein
MRACSKRDTNDPGHESVGHPPMNKITLAISLLFVLGATVYSQEQTPQLLVHAAQCLEAKQFLPYSKLTKLTLGYFLDEKSYPGTKEMYVVIYAAPARSNGLVFAIVLTQRGDHEVFDIQNNASFVLSKDEPIGVSFVNPPLGGTWTQEHLASAIKEIEKQPRFALSIKDLLAADPSLVCESYTDPQPKKVEK